MFEQEFEKLLKQYSEAVNDRKRFIGLVKDFFPDQSKNMNLVIMAYNLGIAEDIQKAISITNAFAFRYVKQLTDDYGLSRANADWVVALWCICYGKNLLGKNCEIEARGEGTGPAIREEKPVVMQYGDLFSYNKSLSENGLIVTGFKGDKSGTIIFQNRFGGLPVVGIDHRAFSNNVVKEIIITDGIKVIGSEAFTHCGELHQIVFSGSVRSIGDHAFEGCNSLKLITLPERIEYVGDYAFAGTGLKTIEIPRTLCMIGKGAFCNCTDMDNITIPSNMDRIPESMFEECTNLKKVKIAEGIQCIEDRAFLGCSSLDFLIIPDSVREIGDTAFEGVNKKFIIQCSMGAYAENYARKHKIKYQLV